MHLPVGRNILPKKYGSKSSLWKKNNNNTHPDTMRERYNIYEMMQAFFDVQGNWIELT